MRPKYKKTIRSGGLFFGSTYSFSILCMSFAFHVEHTFKLVIKVKYGYKISMNVFLSRKTSKGFIFNK